MDDSELKYLRAAQGRGQPQHHAPRNNPAGPRSASSRSAKNRPNRLGSTICKLVAVEGRSLLVTELDAVDGTPVLDIKPVMSEFLPREPVVQPRWSKDLMVNYWRVKER